MRLLMFAIVVLLVSSLCKADTATIRLNAGGFAVSATFNGGAWDLPPDFRLLVHQDDDIFVIIEQPPNGPIWTFGFDEGFGEFNRIRHPDGVSYEPMAYTHQVGDRHTVFLDGEPVSVSQDGAETVVHIGAAPLMTQATPISYVSWWFEGDGRADMNSDGHIGVQDIFDYLIAYFSRR